MNKIKEAIKGFPFRTWSQGYVLGIINGFTLALSMILWYLLHNSLQK